MVGLEPAFRGRPATEPFTLGPMSDPPKKKSEVVKAGMTRVCRDFTELITPLGFRRTNSRSRAWQRDANGTLWEIHFHRGGSSYGAPISHQIDIRVHYWLRSSDGDRIGGNGINSDKLRDSRGYAYHLRFNALSWSMYERCLDDLMRVTREHGMPWFELNGA